MHHTDNRRKSNKEDLFKLIKTVYRDVQRPHSVEYSVD